MQQVLIDGNALGNHGRQELRVVDLFICCRVECLEDGFHLLVSDLEATRERLLQLAHRDGPLPVLVNRNEGVPHPGHLLATQRPGHERHYGTSEAGGLRKVSERVQHALVLAAHTGEGPADATLPRCNEGVFEGIRRGKTLDGVDDEEPPHKVLGHRGDLFPPLGPVGPPPRLDVVDHLGPGARERHVACQQDETHDSEGP
mmetsp:Transcript_39381/g.117875  ORF Transcript_39381/g.117875 Transcript_39381/m.117875 type:complete len:201 (+) Transcript_39381:402-1004(+)